MGLMYPCFCKAYTSDMEGAPFSVGGETVVLQTKSNSRGSGKYPISYRGVSPSRICLRVAKASR